MLISNQFPEELKDLSDVYHQWLTKNLDFTQSELGVALLLRIFIFSDELSTPPPQHLMEYTTTNISSHFIYWKIQRLLQLEKKNTGVI